MKFDAQGWLDVASRTPTENRYTVANPREIIVMHYTASYDAASAVSHFLKASSSASAHFVVGTDGAITQMVSTNECAWHAGYGRYQGRARVNEFSIGIEIVNPGYHYKAANGGYLNWQRKPIPASRLTPFSGMTEAADPWMGSAKAWWPHYPEAQLKAVEKLTKALLKAYPSLRDIVGHRDVDGDRKLKVDPGPAFPMRRFRMLLDSRADAPFQPFEMKVVITDTKLNVRGGPGTNFDTLAWGPLDNGTKLQVVEVQSIWYRVRRWTSGRFDEGWVYAPYLVPVV